ncbi:hypothetical protein L1049_010169 [Liquidambar formosana]|uniref:TIR domain-containing protein n=1 Tax=Liquidambar formosana TaxID=63359 RepID=A0AAP0R6T7_LIQFO
MAFTSIRAESSSPVPPNIFVYDVFLSFRGEDTRKNFTDHMYAALVRHCFSTFRDDDELQRGEEIGPGLLTSIEQSRISVVIFSRNYADSRWCLDELVKILECKRTFKQIVLPIFYGVDPSDVRAQRGTYAQAFAKHEKRYKGSDKMKGKIKSWRDALTEAANLSGYDLQNMADGHEAKAIENIIKDISNRLNPTYLHVADYPVGIESRVQRVIELLELGSDNVRMVGIWGMGGIGKTTIAKAVYKLIRIQFQGSSFLADVREKSEQPNGLVDIQEQLFSDILMNKTQDIRNVHRGTDIIMKRLWSRRVLVVLDDVDDFKQLNALAIRREHFRSGSRIIVTTRDKSLLLKFLKVDEVYEPELLSGKESLQLFSWHAFEKEHPIEDRVRLSREVVDCAGRLPLVLEVWGSLFKCISGADGWKNTLKKLKEIPDADIQMKLRISYDSLDAVNKDLFLDIACFFVGTEPNYAIKVLAACDLYPEIGLQVLSNRSLVRNDGSRLLMHDMIRDMGRDIVRGECHRSRPGERSRLWFHKDVLTVLKYETGTKAVEGLVLNLPESKEELVKATAFAEMSNMRLLQLNYVHLNGSYEHLPKRLRWLCWYGFPLNSIPLDLFLEEVVVLDMCYSSLTHVWEGRKELGNLKFLNLSHSYYLAETPDFSSVTNLETLLLNDCIRLVEVHQSIEALDKLVVLDMSNCKNLWKLPPGIRKLKSLQNFSLSGCSKFEKLQGLISPSLGSTQGLISLRGLDISNCNFSYVPHELGSLFSLKWLDLSGNKNLRELELGTWKLKSLRDINLNDCSNLEKLSGFEGSSSKSQLSLVPSEASAEINSDSPSSDSAEGLTLSLNGCNLSHIPDELGSLFLLDSLDLSGNKKLKELPLGIWKWTSLQTLRLSHCSKLELLFSIFSSQATSARNAASMQGLSPFEHLDLKYCNLSHLPDGIGSLLSLTDLYLQGNNLCTLPASISQLSRLERLNLSECTRLQSLPELPINLKRVCATNCTSLERISIQSDFQASPLLTFHCCHSLKIDRILLPNKEQSAVGKFRIILPGCEVPDYFNYRSEGSVLSFAVSLLPNQRIRGWTLCLVMAGSEEEAEEYEDVNDAWNFDLYYKLKSKTKGFEIKYDLGHHYHPPFGQDHLCLHHVPQSEDVLQMEDGDEVEYSIFHSFAEDDIQVKNWAVNLIYMVDDQKDYQVNDQAMIQDDSPCMGMSCLIKRFQQIKHWFFVVVFFIFFIFLYLSWSSPRGVRTFEPPPPT